MCKKLICLTSFVLVLLALTSAANAQVVNLALNPSFEDDEAILDDPDWVSWATWNPVEGAGSTIEFDDTEFIDGTRSVRINPIGPENWHFIVVNMPIPMEIGKNYTVSLWAKAQEARPLAAQFKAADNSVSWGYADIELTTEWAEHTFTATAENAEVKVELFCATVEVPFWLDFFQVYEGEYVPGIEPRLAVTIPVDPNSDIAAANELAQSGDTIDFAEGTYILTSQIEIKDGVTYQGAGAGLTIIDGNDVTRAFVAWGDRGVTNGQVDANGVGLPNATGPTGWVLDGLTIQNCVSDTVDRQDTLSSARDLLDNYTGTPYTLATAQAENASIIDEPGWFDILSGSADEDLTDVELQAYLDANPVSSAGHLVANDDKNRDGGAISCGNGAVGTIANCEFLNNSTHIDGDDGGAINIAGLSVVTVNDCRFVGNYACSADGAKLDGPDGDGGHIKVQTNAASALTAGTTLIVNRCDFLDGRAEDDGAAIQSSGTGSIIRIDACWFEGNAAADDGTVLFIGSESSGELTVTNCVFANNISTGGSDRLCQVRRNSRFVNCTFVGNSQDDQDMIYNNANNADTDADGADDEAADATQVINCIFLNNAAGDGDDVLGSRNASFTIAATNCLFFGNTLQSGDAADNTQRPDDEVGSIAADPLLDALYVPGAGSPAIDGGIDPVAIGVTLTTDLSGNARPQGAGYDIGAYETPAN